MSSLKLSWNLWKKVWAFRLLDSKDSSAALNVNLGIGVGCVVVVSCRLLRFRRMRLVVGSKGWVKEERGCPDDGWKYRSLVNQDGVARCARLGEARSRSYWRSSQGGRMRCSLVR